LAPILLTACVKLLVAEDDLTTRSMLAGVLARWGYEVVEAEDGREALEVIEESDSVRLAVIDWMMSGMTGLELCREIRRRDRELPIYCILLTARSETEDIVAGLDAGADDYIVKPYQRDELRARLEVGRRVVRLQTQLMDKQKLEGAVEMAGAVCHELNQPLQSVMGYAELLLMDMAESEARYETLRRIKEEVRRIGDLTRKIMHITRYKTKDYAGAGVKIVDIEESSSAAGNARRTGGPAADVTSENLPEQSTRTKQKGREE